MPFYLFCNAMSSTVLPMHILFFVAYESQYTSVTRVFRNACNMDVYIRPWLLILQLEIISMMSKGLQM